MSMDRKPRKIASFKGLDADELKRSVRELLALMNASERKVFITNLEYEMMRARL